MVVEGVCLLAVLIGHLGCHEAGFVGMVNEFPAAADHEFGPPAVQSESQAPPEMLEEDELTSLVVDVEELFVSYPNLYFLDPGPKATSSLFFSFFWRPCSVSSTPLLIRPCPSFHLASAHLTFSWTLLLF